MHNETCQYKKESFTRLQRTYNRKHNSILEKCKIRIMLKIFLIQSDMHSENRFPSGSPDKNKK